MHLHIGVTACTSPDPEPFLIQTLSEKLFSVASTVRAAQRAGSAAPELTSPPLKFFQGRRSGAKGSTMLCASGAIRALGAVLEHVGPKIGN